MYKTLNNEIFRLVTNARFRQSGTMSKTLLETHLLMEASLLLKPDPQFSPADLSSIASLMMFAKQPHRVRSRSTATLEQLLSESNNHHNIR